MDWIAAALGSAAIFAVVNVLEKRILTGRVNGISGFYFLTGALQFVIAAIVILTVSWQGGPGENVTMAALSGIVSGFSLLALYRGLRILDVSLAIPVFQTFPVFVAIMAVFVLDESLLFLHWVAIFTVVIGAGLVAFGQPRKQLSSAWLLGFVALIIASLGMAAGIVASKLALEDMNLWNVMVIRSLFLGTVLVLPAMKPEGFRQIKALFADTRATSVIILTEGVLAGSAIYVTLLALTLGSASLVSTLTSTRPLMVLILSIFLSTRFLKLLDEPFNKDTWAWKFASTIMIVVGVAILSVA